MWRIGLESVALIMVCVGAVSQLLGEAFERRGDFRITGREPALSWPAVSERSAERYSAMPREIVWRPDPNGANPFGFIPTDWTARPQLLPLTWDVRTVFASDGAPPAKRARP
jgi:hypothetical protein